MTSELREQIDMPGGQERAREAILYVAWSCRNAPRFGQTKLHKILWRADFMSFATRGIPVTGRRYQRLPQGPCLHEMLPLQSHLGKSGKIRFVQVDLGNGFTEERIVTERHPDLHYLADRDLNFIDESVFHYWDKTAREASDESHGVIWKTHVDGHPLPYELSLLIDAEPSPLQGRRIEIMGEQRRWQSA